jgi:hypothetical protein
MGQDVFGVAVHAASCPWGETSLGKLSWGKISWGVVIGRVTMAQVFQESVNRTYSFYLLYFPCSSEGKYDLHNVPYYSSPAAVRIDKTDTLYVHYYFLSAAVRVNVIWTYILSLSPYGSRVNMTYSLYCITIPVQQ